MRIYNAGLKCPAHGSLKIEHAKNRHLRTIAQCCPEKNLLNSNISSTCPHNMVNFGPLTAEIDWWVWGTPANFNGFRVLASILYCSTDVAHRRSTKLCTLHDVWPSRELVHYIYIFPCQMQNSLCVQVLRSPILAALLHDSRALGGSENLWRGSRDRLTELSLLVIFALGSESLLMEFRQLENSLQIQELNQMSLTTLFLTCSCWERRAVFFYAYIR